MSDNPLRDALAEKFLRYRAHSRGVALALADDALAVLSDLAGPSGLLDLNTGQAHECREVWVAGGVRRQLSTTRFYKDAIAREVARIVEAAVSTPEQPPTERESLDALYDERWPETSFTVLDVLTSAAVSTPEQEPTRADLPEPEPSPETTAWVDRMMRDPRHNPFLRSEAEQEKP